MVIVMGFMDISLIHGLKYTTLFGRVCNGFSHDFKFAETRSEFHKILYSECRKLVTHKRHIH